MRIAALALVSAAALVLAGCAAEPHTTGSPKPVATPVFRTDAEALAAAEKAYRAYLSVSDEVGAEGGSNPDRLEPYVTSARLKVETKGAESLRSHGYHTTGVTHISNAALQSVRQRGGNTSVTFYVCWDVSNIRVIDSRGADVTPQDRPPRITLQVEMRTTAGKLPLLLASDESWPGASVC